MIGFRSSNEVPYDYGDRLQIAKINVGREHHRHRVKSGVRGIPTLTLFKNGAVAAQ